MFGISPDTPVTMQDYYDSLHPDDREAVAAAYAAAADPARRALYDVEYRTIGKEDRVVRWVAAKGRGIFDDGNRCVRVIGTAIDITQRKRVEQQLRELNQTLERHVTEALAERKILADVVDGTDIFVQVADCEHTWLAINRAAAAEFSRIFGVPEPRAGNNMLVGYSAWFRPFLVPARAKVSRRCDEADGCRCPQLPPANSSHVHARHDKEAVKSRALNDRMSISSKSAVRRRELLAGVVGAIGFCPLSLGHGAEQPRRVGLLLGFEESDIDAQFCVQAFRDRMSELGWPTSKLELQIRWAAGSNDLRQRYAKELVALGPDVILAGATPEVIALIHETHTIPVVFTSSGDPIGSGFVKALAAPGGNVTGFSNNQGLLATKWVSLLKEAAPDLTVVGVLFHPDMAAGGGAYYTEPMREAGKTLGIAITPLPVRNLSELEAALSRLHAAPHAGVVGLPDVFMTNNRKAIAEAVNRLGLPSTFASALYPKEGGLLFYGVDLRDTYVLGANYVDRILRGAKPAEMPVQAPTRFKFVINQRTAARLNLTLSPALAAAADEILE